MSVEWRYRIYPGHNDQGPFFAVGQPGRTFKDVADAVEVVAAERPLLSAALGEACRWGGATALLGGWPAWEARLERRVDGRQTTTHSERLIRAVLALGGCQRSEDAGQIAPEGP